MRALIRKRQNAFTMVEMLVVIAIIGILMAILIPTLQAAIKASREAAIRFELVQLAHAMDEYKNKTGQAYPPDFTNPSTVKAYFEAHVKKISRNNNDNVAVNAFLIFLDSAPYSTGDGNPDNGIISAITPDEALVFWLSMTAKSAEYPIRDYARVDVAAGQFPDPDDHRIFFEFDQARLIDFDGDGFPSYVPKYGRQVPYVYFDSRTYNQRYDGDETNNAPANFSARFIPNPAEIPDAAAAPNTARPYLNSSVKKPPTTDLTGAAKADFVADLETKHYVEPNGFQIISAGYDGNYGSDLEKTGTSGTVLWIPRLPEGTYGDEEQVPPYTTYKPPTPLKIPHRDNSTSFAEGRLDKNLAN